MLAETRVETRDGIDVVVLTNGPRARADVVPAFGNNCYLFEVGTPVLEPVSWGAFKQKPTSYGIPILFPFPNRIRGGTFEFQGRRYHVDPARHGFARQRPWTVQDMDTSESGAWVESVFDAGDYPDILEQFPHLFSVSVMYFLNTGCLEMSTVVSNNSDGDMPMGFGIHPYFRRTTDAELTVPAQRYWEIADSLPTGRVPGVDGRLDLRSPRRLEGLEYDDILTDLIADAEGQVRCALASGSEGRTVSVSFSAAEFPEVVVYTAPAPRQSVCIEPNTCPTDAFNLHARGIDSHVRVLREGESARFVVTIAVEDAGR